MILKILKFGGTSVGTKEAIDNVINIVSTNGIENKIVVVSAPSKVTDILLRLINNPSIIEELKDRLYKLIDELGLKREILNELNLELTESLNLELPQKEKSDLIVSFGERFSILILSQYYNQLNNHKPKAIPVDSRDFVVTNSNFTNAKYDLKRTKAKANKVFGKIVKMGQLAIVTGFIGKDKQGRTTTLGRGGSDLTATIIGECLNADIVEIWTDANGIMTADPRKVDNAQLIEKISYKETFELSNFGAKVIQSRALIPGFNANVPVKVLNTFNPNSTGTLITEETSEKVFSITSKDNIATLTVFSPEMIGTPGFLAKLFEIFAKLEISIDVISVSESSVSLTIFNLPEDVENILIEHVSEIGKVIIKKNCSILALISNFLKKNQHLVADAINILDENNIDIEMISYGNSEINLTFVVKSTEVTKAINILHDHFLNVFNKLPITKISKKNE